MFVSKEYRRMRVGTLLLNEIIKNSQLYFSDLRLFTNSENASSFYKENGFEESFEYKESHKMRLKRNIYKRPILSIYQYSKFNITYL